MPEPMPPATQAHPPKPPASSARWQLQMLGGLQARRDDQLVTSFGGRNATALLARLALFPQRNHAREELIELLWPGVDVETGRNRLRQALFALRQVFEPPGAPAMLSADRLSVRIAPGVFDCDVLQFERAVRAGDPAQAMALYGGELLPGFYDEWIDDERLRLTGLHDRISSMAPSQLVAAARPETAAAAAAPADVGRNSLPVFLTRFFGREAEGDRLRSEVLTHRLVTLLGPGGSGKTRLSVELAAGLRGHGDPEASGFDFIAFVSLINCRTQTQLLDALLAALQLRHTAGDAFAPLRAALAGRHALLVLDNFEQVQGDGAPVVGQLLNELPSLHVLATSRRVLGLDGEREFPIEPLALPPRDATLPLASTTPSLALFIDRARAARPGFSATPDNLDALVDLAHLLEGMPLAIELAAARARSIAPAAMATLLRQARSGAGGRSLELLQRAGPRHASDARHASMVDVIEWSWRMLADADARLLAALTVFQGGFTADAAEAVCGDIGSPVNLGLDELVSHSLLRTLNLAEASGLERFVALEPVREYAMRQLSVADQRLRREHHRQWLIRWAGALPATPPLNEVRAEMPNVLAALASALADDVPEQAILLLIPLHRVLEDVELPAEGLALVAQALDACGDTELRSRGHTLIAPLRFIAGHSEPARRHAADGLALAPPGSPWRGRALYVAARIEWRISRQLSRLQHGLDEADSIAEAGSDLELQASMRALRAAIANRGGDHALGEQLHGQALALWERTGNQHAVNNGRYNLAALLQTNGHHDQALQRLDVVEASARALNDWRRLSQILNVRGNALSELRRWPEAVESFRESIRLAWNCMAMYELAFGLWNVPRALSHLREAERSVQISSFAVDFWESRFGELGANDHHDLRRLRRLNAVQLEAARAAELATRGRGLSPAEAVALALQG